MDDIRSKQRKPDDPRYIGIVFADGSGKFVNIGKLAFIDQCLPTECPCNIGYHRVGKTRLRIRRDNSFSSGAASERHRDCNFDIPIFKYFHFAFPDWHDIFKKCSQALLLRRKAIFAPSYMGKLKKSQVLC